MKAVAALIVIAVILIGIIGWAINIVKLSASLSSELTAELTAELVLRIIGIPIAPIGVVMGLFV
jgi:hypothetical protein